MDSKVRSFEQMAYVLWQGGMVGIDEIQSAIKALAEAVVASIPVMKGAGIDFPMEYLTAATANISNAFNSQDSYLMADCLYYEWKEIETVYMEVMQELGQV